MAPVWRSENSLGASVLTFYIVHHGLCQGSWPSGFWRVSGLCHPSHRRNTLAWQVHITVFSLTWTQVLMLRKQVLYPWSVSLAHGFFIWHVSCVLVNSFFLLTVKEYLSYWTKFQAKGSKRDLHYKVTIVQRHMGVGWGTTTTRNQWVSGLSRTLWGLWQHQAHLCSGTGKLGLYKTDNNAMCDPACTMPRRWDLPRLSEYWFELWFRNLVCV